MPSKRKREEVLNVHLAMALKEQGLVSVPEAILRLPSKKRRYPDVLVEYRDLRIAIEGKISDVSGAYADCLQAANERVEERIADAALAIIYPEELRTAPPDRLRSRTNPPLLKVATVQIGKASDFRSVTVPALAEVLRALYEDIIGEDVIREAVEIVEEAVISFDKYTVIFKSAMERLAPPLGMEDPKNEDELIALRRIGGLVLFNAFVFQEVLSGEIKGIKPLRDFYAEGLILNAFMEHWGEILKVNWYPIFHIARNIVRIMPFNMNLVTILRMMMDGAQEIVSKRVALRHDLMGRVYHTLLAEKKFLATYFTSIPAAALLLRLALHRTDICNDIESVSKARIADIACGTGTLLMAAASVVEENYIRASIESDRKPDLLKLHRVLLENTLYGFDVLPSAVHLTASTLALRSPAVNFFKTNLYVLPHGGEDNSLGSIDFIVKNHIAVQKDLFSEPESRTARMTSDSAENYGGISLPQLDVCVMNPPFTRSVGGNLLFGSVPVERRRKMQQKLKSILRSNNVFASATAGLGAVFIAVADRYLKPNGKMVLVLPMTALSGVSWAKTRQLWASKYVLEWVVTSHDPRKWNFSESTELSEVLLVLRKSNTNRRKEEHTKFVNLWHNSRFVFDTVGISLYLREVEPPNILTAQAGLPIRLGKEVFGEVLSVPFNWLKEQDTWLIPGAFAQSLLTKVALSLVDGRVSVPGEETIGKIPLIPLGVLADLGPDRRNVHNGFHTPPAKSPTPFSCFWSHDSASVLSVKQEPNGYLRPRPRPKKGYALPKVESLWRFASPLLLAERLRLNTHRLSSVLVSEPVLSNVWWTVRLKSGGKDSLLLKALCLWFNSSLGWVLLLMHREQTQGAWIDFKKTALTRLPVLDVSRIGKRALKRLSDCFDEVADAELKPLSEAETDEIRMRIDEVVSKALGLPDVSSVRRLLANEPVVTLKPLG